MQLRGSSECCPMCCVNAVLLSMANPSFTGTSVPVIDHVQWTLYFSDHWLQIFVDNILFLSICSSPCRYSDPEATPTVTTISSGQWEHWHWQWRGLFVSKFLVSFSCEYTGRGREGGMCCFVPLGRAQGIWVPWSSLFFTGIQHLPVVSYEGWPVQLLMHSTLANIHCLVSTSC